MEGCLARLAILDVHIRSSIHQQLEHLGVTTPSSQVEWGLTYSHVIESGLHAEMSYDRKWNSGHMTAFIKVVTALELG